MRRMILFVAALTGMGCMMAATPERKQLFDSDWSFSRDSIQWQTVNLPHDWSIEGDFDKEAPAGNDGAYLPTGKGWYRKEFRLDDSEAR